MEEYKKRASYNPAAPGSNIGTDGINNGSTEASVTLTTSGGVAGAGQETGQETGGEVEWPREGSLTPPPPLTLPEKRVAHWKKLCELQKEELMNLMSVNAVMMLPLRHHRPRCVSEVIFHTPYAHSHHSCESLSFKSYTHPI